MMLILNEILIQAYKCFYVFNICVVLNHTYEKYIDVQFLLNGVFFLSKNKLMDKKVSLADSNSKNYTVL